VALAANERWSEACHQIARIPGKDGAVTLTEKERAILRYALKSLISAFPERANSTRKTGQQSKKSKPRQGNCCRNLEASHELRRQMHELAEHFLPDECETKPVQMLAQVIQDAIEDWLEAQRRQP